MPGFFKKVKSFLTRRNATRTVIDKEIKKQLTQLKKMNKANLSEQELMKLARTRALNQLESKGFKF